MSKLSDLAKQGIFYQPLGDQKPQEEDGDFMRGVKKAAYQIPQTIGGAAGLIGDMTGADGLRDYGMQMYQNNEDKIQAITKDSDSLTNVLDGDGSALSWAKNAAGYTAGQAVTALATGGVGGFIGKQLAKQGIKAAIARGAESAVGSEAAAAAAQQAISRGTKMGAGSALFGSNLTQEAGSIYPDALQQAQEDGRVLTAADKARIVGSAFAAAGVDTAMDGVIAHKVLAGGRKEGESILRAAVREVPGMAAKEAATEGVQTGIERYGARQDMTSADAIRDYVDSMGVGAMGGGMGGGISVLHAQKVADTGPMSRAANIAIDDQILQLTHDPQPLISFPDGSVGHKQDMEAYLTQFTDPEERLAKRRELMGRDPATGKRIQPEEAPAPEPAPFVDNASIEKQNVDAWAARHKGVTLDHAQALMDAPGAKGMDLMIVPHPKGSGYTVVPSKWLTLDSQAKYAALQKGDEGRLAAPDANAPSGVLRVDSEGGIAPETNAEQSRTKAAQREQASAAAEEAQRRIDLGTPVPNGTKATPKPIPPAPPLKTIMTLSGKPYLSKVAATRALNASYSETHEVSKAPDGPGFVLTPKPAALAAAEVAPSSLAPPVDELDTAAHEAATSPHNDLPEPTQGQKDAGNYRKGHIDLHGLDITIENPAGSNRSGTDRGGKAWSQTMSNHYGYIRRTEGADGDHVDAFIGPNPSSDRAFVVDQIHPHDGSFDEHKVILGANSLDEARKIYAANYAKGWKGGKNVAETSVEGFKAWLKDGDTTKPFAPQIDQQAASGAPEPTAGSTQPAPVDATTKEANADDRTAAAPAASEVVPAGSVPTEAQAVAAKPARAPDWREATAKKEAKLQEQLATANANAAARKAAKEAKNAPEAEQTPPTGNSDVIPSGNEVADERDTGADIPQAFFKKVKVQHEVWIEDEKQFVEQEVPAHKALASVREDIANLTALLKCMKG